MSIDSRESHDIQRIRDSLKNEGITEKVILESSKHGVGSSKSYFEALVDIRLKGFGDPTSREVWDGMKAQINYLTSALVKASDDYSKLEGILRRYKEDEIYKLKDLIKKSKQSKQSKQNKQSKQTFVDETYLMQIQSLKNIEAREKRVVYKVEALNIDGYGREDDIFIGVYSTSGKANAAFLEYFKDFDADVIEYYRSSISEIKIDDYDEE